MDVLIYLLCSGIADGSTGGVQEQNLTHDGVMQCRSMVRKFRVYAPVMDVALISPYKTAKQTSEALTLSFPTMEFEVSELLNPDADG
jgi:phosphohistidine phosphatase SixA